MSLRKLLPLAYKNYRNNRVRILFQQTIALVIDFAFLKAQKVLGIPDFEVKKRKRKKYLKY